MARPESTNQHLAASTQMTRGQKAAETRRRNKEAKDEADARTH